MELGVQEDAALIPTMSIKDTEKRATDCLVALGFFGDHGVEIGDVAAAILLVTCGGKGGSVGLLRGEG